MSNGQQFFIDPIELLFSLCDDEACPKKNECARHIPKGANHMTLRMYYAKSPGYWQDGKFECEMFRKEKRHETEKMWPVS